MTAMTSRRAVLAGVAAVPVASLPMIAVAADPVFAAIDRHRKAYAAWSAALRVVPIDAAGWTAKQILEAEEYGGEMGDVAHEVLADLLKATPATAAGCVAMLRYVENYAREFDAELFGNYFEVVKNPASTLLARIADTIEKSA